jgi:sugar phosphate isomerase/epimerase
MSIISRRTFVKQSGIITVSTLTFGRSREGRPSGSEPNVKFPPALRDRLAVASWPFRGLIEAPENKWARDPKLPGMDLKDFGAMVVKRFGLHNIEPLDSHFRSKDPAYIQEVRAATEKAGAHVINVAVDIRSSYYDPDPAKRKNAVDTSRTWIENAAALGAPSVRLHIAGVEKVKPDLERTAESLKRVADYAAAKNIVANLENDDNFTEDPFFIVAVLERVKNPFLRALPDFCNSMLTHDQGFNDRALRALFSHAYSIAHVKDSEVGDKGKLFTVDVAKCFEIARQSGFRGYFSMEWEGSGEPFAGTRKLIDLSVKHLG